MPAIVHLNVPHGQSIPRPMIERGVGLALERDGVLEGEISVTFLPDDLIRELNRRWLDHDWVPDVLSFSLHEPGEPPVGDIYIGVDQAFRQAMENGVSRDEELVRLAIHGVLHILGHEHSEHMDGPVEGGFFARQESLLREATEYGETGLGGDP